MENIKVSVIIPNFNSGELLEKLLATIPRNPEIQIIVVDDYSTKQLEKLDECKQKYVDDNVVFCCNEAMKGAGGARNTGLRYAKGEWILFADADDYFLEEFYEKIKGFLNSSYDIVYFRSTSIDLITQEIADRHNSTELYIRNYLDNPNKKNLVRLKYNYFSPCAKLIKRKLFCEGTIFFDEVMVANDVMCSIRLAFLAKTIYVADEVIYCITKQPGTLTTMITEERYDERMTVYYRRHKYLKENLPRDEYKLLRFNARLRLQQTLRYSFGWKKYFTVLFEMLRQGVPIWREFSPLYYGEAICYYLKVISKKYGERYKK